MLALINLLNLKMRPNLLLKENPVLTTDHASVIIARLNGRKRVSDGTKAGIYQKYTVFCVWQ